MKPNGDHKGHMGMEFEAYDSVYFDSCAVSFVQQALQEAIAGNLQNYDQLVSLMDPSMNLSNNGAHSHESQEDREALVVATLRALSEVVSHIDVVHHQSLYSSILGISIWKCNRLVRDALLELVVHLAASSGKFLDACLDMLVCHFIPPPLNFRHRWKTLKTEVTECIFSALQEICYLVPFAPMRLLPIIERRMPAKFAPKAVNEMYVECILKLKGTRIGEFIGSSLLKAVVDKLVDLDVEIRWEDILHTECNRGIFDMELEDLAGNVPEDTGMASSKITYAVKENKVSDTLDSLMTITCQHLKDCADTGHLSKVFGILMESFQKSVLTAHRSKFVQFLMFYSCSLDPGNCGVTFALRLREIFLSNSDPPLNRISAVSYLASYLSRAKFQSSSFVVKILRGLIDWCSEYVHGIEGKERTKNIAVHQVFYSGFQAILYVLCFRLRSIVDDPSLKGLLVPKRLEAIFVHGLDPLKVCLPSIVEEFLRQANATEIFSFETTKKFDRLLGSDLSKGYKAPEWLDMFFPFDPYLLKESDRFIRPSFEFWSMVRTTYDHSDVEDAEEISDDEEKHHNDPDDDLQELENEHELGCSMDAMSITPNDPFSHFPGNGSTQMPARIRPSTCPDL